MKNNKLNFIIFIIIFTIMLICPMKADAKTYYASDYYSPIYIDKVIYEPGDVLDFTNSFQYYNYGHTDILYFYLNNELLSNNCYGNDESCIKKLVVNDRMIINKIQRADSNSGIIYEVNLIKLKENDELIEKNISSVEYWQNDEYTDTNNYYKSGDLIKLYSTANLPIGISWYVYDDNDNIIENGSFFMNIPSVFILPKINNKDYYWIMSTKKDNGIYNSPIVFFRPFYYTEPKIELKCDKDKINYGEKTRCEVYLESPYKMSNLNFSINHKNLKLSNISYLDGITNSSNDNQIMKLSFGDNNSFIEKKVIMTFDVEGTKDSSYLDNISLENIEYTDEVLTAKYENLNSDLNIISTKPLTNPETGIRTLFIIMPILLLIIIASTSLFINKKKTTN